MTGFDKHGSILKPGWLLALTALIGTGLMFVVNFHSNPYIEKNEKETLLRTLNSVLPSNIYDNDILNDTISIVDKKFLGSDKATLIYRARKDNRPSAAALQVIAPNGYSGDIVLLVGVASEGDVTGVRVLKHKETPGLGDNIEIQRSNWIGSFAGKSLNNTSASGWMVKKDGGDFDQFTGATITPRAVVSAVHKALIYFTNNKSKIFSKPVNQDETG